VGVEAPGYQRIAGDVAWGGNWFFLAGVDDVPFTVGNVGELTDFTWAIRGALASAGITGANGAEIDHIELYSAAHHPGNHSRNFVLCPGKAYDRSPCGTGTSAKLACLAAEGLLEPGQAWRQEGILGTVFEGSYQFEDADLKVESDNDSRETPAIDPRIIPTVTGSAFVMMEGTMIFDPRDPFQVGVPE
jgi:4-hydroxyproline epimerase